MIKYDIDQEQIQQLNSLINDITEDTPVEFYDFDSNTRKKTTLKNWWEMLDKQE